VHERQHVLLGLIHELAALREATPQLVDRLAPLIARLSVTLLPCTNAVRITAATIWYWRC
jgi:hypothetical protein